MSYATNADVQTRVGTIRYVQLTDDSASGVADESKVTQARVAAEAEVNSYVGRRYAVPVSTAGQGDVAAALLAVTVDLAEHRLYERRPPVPEDVRRRREAAIQWLEAVASGAVVLPASVELAEAGGRVTVSGRGRVLTREEMERF